MVRITIRKLKWDIWNVTHIKKHNISRITFYALNPHPGTMFKKSPDKEYYSKWVEKFIDLPY